MSKAKKKPSKKAAPKAPKKKVAKGKVAGRKAAKKAAPGVPKDWPAAKTEVRRTSRLVPYARNARTHSKAQVAKIAASIREWGWTNPILVTPKGTIVAGHGRVLAAEQLGIEDVPVMVARGWSEAQVRAYVIADNQLAIDAGWNKDVLSIELSDLAELDFDLSLTGFNDLSLKGLLEQGEELPDDGGLPSKSVNPFSREGDLWLLGGHRLLCGDSTVKENVERVLNGEVPRLMVTDPPYGVEYDPKWRDEVDKEMGRPPINRSTGKVSNDDRVDWSSAWDCFPGDVAYVWHAGLFCGEVLESLTRSGFDGRSQIIWSKSRFALSRGNYHWQHEPCWYAVRKGSKAHWIGDHSQSTIWKIDSTDDGDKTVHSTQKPLECMGRPMRHHDSPIVYDPFLGSGTTLIAAHLQDRKCYGLELDPGYVDVIIERWQKHSGEEAVLDGDGRTFAEIGEARA